MHYLNYNDLYDVIKDVEAAQGDVKRLSQDILNLIFRINKIETTLKEWSKMDGEINI